MELARRTVSNLLQSSRLWSGASIALDAPAGDARPGDDAIRHTAVAPGPRLLDQVRAAIRARHYSRRTEAAYTHWIRRFVLFHGKRHPTEMAEPEITAYLTHLAVRGRVSASTQSQALSALLFLYTEAVAA